MVMPLSNGKDTGCSGRNDFASRIAKCLKWITYLYGHNVNYIAFNMMSVSLFYFKYHTQK